MKYKAFQKRRSTEMDKIALKKWRGEKESIGIKSIKKEIDLVKVTIRMEHKKDAIKIRGKRGDNFMSNHPHLKNNRRIRCVNVMAKKMKMEISSKSVSLMFFGLSI